jgi:hypothetical protein
MDVVPALRRIAHSCSYRGSLCIVRGSFLWTSAYLFFRLVNGRIATSVRHLLTLLVAVVLASRLALSVPRKWGSITIDGGVVSLLMNTGRSVCDLNRHALSLLNTHSLIKSATNIGGFD